MISALALAVVVSFAADIIAPSPPARAPVPAAAPTPTPAQMSIAVIDLQSAGPDDVAMVKLLSEALVQAVASSAKDARVIGLAELRRMLDAAALQQLLGCDDERCSVDFSRELAVDRLVLGRAGRVGDQNLVFLSLVDAKTHEVLARTSHAFGIGEDVRNPAGAAADGMTTTEKATRIFLERMQPAALALFLPEAAERGDRPLAELRMAVLLDEVDEAGTMLRTHPVETCVSKQLLDGGASLVSSAVVKTLKGKAGPRQILDGQIPDDLGTDEVDVLFAGIVTYAPHADAAAAKFPGLSFARAEMGAQLVRVDTGAVLASEQPTGLGKGYNVDASRKGASDKLCAEVKPLLEAALRKRFSMGERVVLEVQGIGVDDAGELVKALEKVRRVGKARLKKADGKRAILDVALAAGDGLALALELGKLGVIAESATPGKVMAKKGL